MPGWRAISIASFGVVVLCYLIHHMFADDTHDYAIAIILNIYLITGLIAGILVNRLSCRVAKPSKRPFAFMLLLAIGGLAPDAAQWIWATLNWP